MIRLIITTLFIFSIAYADYKELALQTTSQPNGVQFTCKYWGDEYFHYWETGDGYRILRGSDGYWYYATLDANGEFTKTSLKVGIDSAPSSSYNLMRSQARTTELQALQDTTKYYIGQNAGWFQNVTYPYELKVGVILIDFTPSHRYRGTGQDYPDGYEKALYENFYFSSNIWKGTGQQTPHPDNHPLFGSVNDYYYDQSNGNVSIVGKNGQSLIVNEADPQNSLLPLWLELPNSIEYYGNTANFENRYELAGHFFNAAVAEYGSALIETFDCLVFIFGGKEGTNGNLASGFSHPTSYYGFPSTNVKAVIIIGEQSINSNYGGFNHIGGHVHELGHVIGLSDEYEGTISPGSWEVMANGESNKSGELYTGNCPAPFSPVHKLYLRWDSPILLTESSGETEILRDTNRPFLYKVEIPNSDEYFVIERRDGSGFEAYTPNATIGQGNWRGILIWHGKESATFDRVELESSASGNYLFSNTNENPYVNNVSTDYLNETSTPSNSKLRDGIIFSERNIIIRNKQYFGPYHVDVFAEVDDPSPAMPANFTGMWYGNYPKVTFTANTEIDLKHYLILKNSGSGFEEYATTTNTYFIDYAEHKYSIGSGTKTYVYYKAQAVDLADQKSAMTNQAGFAVNEVGSEQSQGEIDESINIALAIPEEYELNQNYPNPFNPVTQIKFSLPQLGYTSLKIYNIQGQLVQTLVDANMDAGYHYVDFNGYDLSSGIYIYELKSGIFHQLKRMLLIK